MLIADDCIDSSETAQLLADACRGDTQAFCRLVIPWEDRLLRQAMALCRDPATAEDLVSETLVEAWKSLPRYDQNCRLSTWLYAILLHRHQKTVRSARSRPIPLARLPFRDAEKHAEAQKNLPASEVSPDARIIQSEFGENIRRAVDSLPEKHRQVILLRFFEEASLEEMAAVLGCSVGTVKSRLHYALGRLRRLQVCMNLSE